MAKPRRKTASSYFSKHNYDTLIKPTVDAECATVANKKHWVKIRAKHITQMYDALSGEQKLQYTDESFTQHQAAVEEWERVKKGPVSQMPEDRQRYVSCS